MGRRERRAKLGFNVLTAIPAAMTFLAGLADAAQDGRIDQDEMLDLVFDLVAALGIKAHIDVE